MQPRWGEKCSAVCEPRVAAKRGNPWASRRNPFGVKQGHVIACRRECSVRSFAKPLSLLHLRPERMLPIAANYARLRSITCRLGLIGCFRASRSSLNRIVIGRSKFTHSGESHSVQWAECKSTDTPLLVVGITRSTGFIGSVPRGGGHEAGSTIWLAGMLLSSSPQKKLSQVHIVTTENPLG